MKKIIYSLIFIILVIMVLIKTDKLLFIKWIGVDTFYKNIEESYDVDVLFLGTSRFGITFRPLYIFKKYGVISYNMGTSAQPFLITQLLLKKYKPKYAVIDVSVLLSNDMIRKRVDLVNLFTLYERPKIAKYLFDNKSYKSEINIFSKYHSRWKELRKNDFYNEEYSYAKGAWLAPRIFYTTNNLGNIPYYKKSYKYEHIVKEIVGIAQKSGTEIIFIAPCNMMVNRDFYSQFKQYAVNNNLDYIDYNDKKLMKELNLDYTKGMMDISHLNMYGSYKVMDHLIPYMIKKYKLQDYRFDSKYKSWYYDMIKYDRVMNKLEIVAQTQINKWLNLAYYDNYTMLISTNGDDVLNRLPNVMKDKFKSIGLTKFETDKKNQKYVAIIDDNQVFFEEVSDSKVEYKGRMKNIVNLLVSSENRKATINVSGKPRAKNQYGINFVIYDKVNREIVDSIWVDPAKADVIRR